MEDHEYPDWLWNLIGDGRAVSKKDLGEGDASRGHNWVENVGKRVVRQTYVLPPSLLYTLFRTTTLYLLMSRKKGSGRSDLTDPPLSRFWFVSQEPGRHQDRQLAQELIRRDYSPPFTDHNMTFSSFRRLGGKRVRRRGNGLGRNCRCESL